MIARPRSVVGLDIGTSSVKAIELTQNGREIEVTGFGQVELPSEEQDDQIQAVQELLQEGGFRTRRVITAISGKQVIVRYLNMVRMSDEELGNAIQFEAEKYIPFPLDECVMDCQRLESGDDRPNGSMTVLLVAAKRHQVDTHLELLAAAGLTPEVVDVDAFALGNANWLCLHSEGSSGNDRTEAFVDVGCSKTEINIMRGAHSLFTREISIGGQHFTEAVAKRLGTTFEEAELLKREPGEGNQAVMESVFPAIDDLGNEIQLSFDYFENQFEKEIEGIFLSGGGSRLEGFAENLERIFEKPTRQFNPFERLHVNSELDADLLAANGPQLVVATGLASRMRRES